MPVLEINNEDPKKGEKFPPRSLTINFNVPKDLESDTIRTQLYKDLIHLINKAKTEMKTLYVGMTDNEEANEVLEEAQKMLKFNLVDHVIEGANNEINYSNRKVNAFRHDDIHRKLAGRKKEFLDKKLKEDPFGDLPNAPRTPMLDPVANGEYRASGPYANIMSKIRKRWKNIPKTVSIDYYSKRWPTAL